MEAFVELRFFAKRIKLDNILSAVKKLERSELIGID
jgi:hypothetical protein